MKKRFKKTAKVALGLGTLGLTILGLTGCNKKLYRAQDNLNGVVLDTLNSDENSKYDIGGEFSSYSFLGSDVEKQDDSKYHVGINGISYSEKSNRQALTTLNYVVDDSYFSEVENSDNKLVNALAEIVKNEESSSIAVNKVNDINALNNTLLNCIEYDKSFNKNFLYGVKNFEIGDDSASFNAESVAQYSYLVMVSGGNGIFVPVTHYSEKYINQKIAVKLSKEEAETAKQDESYIFDKFIECVKSNQKDNYSVTLESCDDYKKLTAFNFDYENCIENSLEK